jgi:TonB family protein
MRGSPVPVRLCVICLWLLAASPLAAADRWIEAKSDHFTIVSNAGDRTARRVAWQFEQIRAAIEKWSPFSRPKAMRPVLIIAAKNEATLKELAPSEFAGPNPLRPGAIPVTAEDRTYIALRTDAKSDTRAGANPYGLAYWSYTDVALDAAFERKLPAWLNRGVAAVWSNLVVEDDHLEFGRPLPQYVEQMRRATVVGIRGLLTATSTSPVFVDPSTRHAFDAQSWALVHYLMFQAPKATGSEGLNAALALIMEGMSSDVAIERSFGNLDVLEQAYIDFATKGKFTFTRLPADIGISAEKYPVRALPDAEVGILRARFLLASGHPAEARAVVAEARTRGASAKEADEIDGLALDRDGQRDAAREALKRAVAGGSTSALAFLRLADLTWTPSADPATRKEVHDWLVRSVAINPASAPALAFLGNVLLQLEKPEAALLTIDRALAREPDRVAFRILRARALMELRKYEDALTVAKTAQPLAKTDQERRALQSLVDAMTQAVKVPREFRDLAAAAAALGSRPQGDTKPLVRTKHVPPIYPPIAQSARIQGNVVVAALIGKDGRVVDVAVVQSIPLLDQAAIDAVRQWEFEPPTRVNGEAAAISTQITISFTLN